MGRGGVSTKPLFWDHLAFWTHLVEDLISAARLTKEEHQHFMHFSQKLHYSFAVPCQESRSLQTKSTSTSIPARIH